MGHPVDSQRETGTRKEGERKLFTYLLAAASDKALCRLCFLFVISLKQSKDSWVAEKSSIENIRNQWKTHKFTTQSLLFLHIILNNSIFLLSQQLDLLNVQEVVQFKILQMMKSLTKEGYFGDSFVYWINHCRLFKSFNP